MEPPAPAGIIDTHVHLDDPAFDNDREAVLAASRANGVAGFINIGYRPQSWEASRRLREQHPDVAIALGLHPGNADEFGPELDRALRGAIEELRPLAVGETGFDFARSGPSFGSQERAFRAQLGLAQEYSLPVIIHQRAAGEQVMAELDRWPDLAPIVLHSFDGNERLMDWALDRGCIFGVGGLATRPGSGLLREQLARVPPHAIVLETDAPYLAPPGAPSRRNTPANLPAIAGMLSSLWSLSPEELCLQTTSNAIELFGLEANQD